MGFVNFCSKFFIGIVVLTLALLYVPGVPPHVNFSAFNVEPSQPREGPLAKNYILNDAEQIFKGYFVGPESIASIADDELYVSLHNGDIVRVWGQDFDKSEVVANLGPGGCAGPWEEHICGRPLGLRFTKDKKLLIADAYLGLFKLDIKTGKKERLVDPSEPIEGLRPLLVDDLDIDDSGNIYWSDASSTAPLDNGLIDLASDPSGRLIKYNAKTKKCEVLLSNLNFANGVQLSPDQKFVLVAQTFNHCVTRYWLKGPKAGTSDMFVSGLPGMPDNIRARKEGGYYVSLVSGRNPDQIDLYELTSNLPGVRKVACRITALIQKLVDFINYYFPNRFCSVLSSKIFSLGVMTNVMDTGETIVVEVDEEGKIIGSLQGSSEFLRGVSQTQQVGDYIFFGSPWAPYLGRLHIDKIKKRSAQEGTASTKPKPSSKAKEEL